jgi:Flp pilus assembly pilin Flp
MQHLSFAFRQLWDDESGQDMVEYVMIIVFLALAVTVGLLAMRGSMSDAFRNASETVQTQDTF